MKIIFDTNVILDVFLEREPFFEASSQVLGFAEQDKMEGWICGTTVTTIHYLLTKALTLQKAKGHLKELFKNISHFKCQSHCVRRCFDQQF